MSNPNQTSDKSNGDSVAGTGLKTLTPRDSGASLPVSNGPSGENATAGNRNKKS